MATEKSGNGINKTRTLSMGEGTHEVPLELFALNRRRLSERLRTMNLGNSVVVLQGGTEVHFNDTDVTLGAFRQESYFMWAFGVREPGVYGTIDVQTGKSTLFIPKLPISYSVWMGPIMTTQDVIDTYGVDEAYYVEDIESVLHSKAPNQLLTLEGINTDSGLTAVPATFPGIDNFKVDKKILFNEIAELRVIKTDLELEVLRYVCKASSEAHMKVMRFAAPGKFEYQCEAEFLGHCYGARGCRHVSYTCICGAGTNSAILHYGHAGAPNDTLIEDGHMCLFDMGANYFGYAADITCSFPANGKFTADQKLVYNAVLKASLAVQNAAKPGVSWVDMHLLANRTVLGELKAGGVLKGEVDDMMKAQLGYYFQPHGLGHLLGLDVHDVGGYLPGQPERPTEKGPDRLRFARILQKGMFVTVEPGCYFIDPLLDEILGNPNLLKFVVKERLENFRGFGGVRIEDDVYIGENGVENYSIVPRTVEEIERWMAGLDNGKYN